MICKHILITFLNEAELFFSHAVKWFHVLLPNTNNYIHYQSFTCPQLNGFKYFYKTVLLCISNSSTKHQSFVRMQLNDQTVLFLAIQYSINHLFVHSLNIKQFYFTHWQNYIKCYHLSIARASSSDSLASLFWTLIGGVLLLSRDAVGVFYCPNHLGKIVGLYSLYFFL